MSKERIIELAYPLSETELRLEKTLEGLIIRTYALERAKTPYPLKYKYM